jgi:hypothetical protein
MKKVLFLILILVFSANIFAQQAVRDNLDLTQYGIRIEPDKRLIVVMASLEAAGLKTPLSESGEEYRKLLQKDLESVPTDTRERIKSFVEQYKRRHPKSNDSEVIAPFVSMAFSLSPVPDLVEPTNVNDLPGDLLDVLDYTPLVREFYRRSNFSSNLDNYVKMYQDSGDKMRGSAKIMVRDLLDYMRTKPQLLYIERVKTEAEDGKKKRSKLRSTGIREHERRFFIVPEMLAPKGAINLVNVSDDYSAIVPPETNLVDSEVRRAYLQFVIDPLILENAKDIFEKSDQIKALLSELKTTNSNISPDVLLMVSRSLVAAIDARQVEHTKGRNATFQARQIIIQIEKQQEAEKAKKIKDGEKFNEKEFDEKFDNKKREVVAELNKFKEGLADESALKLSEAYEKGAVLSFYFAQKLEGLEDAGFDIASVLNDMIVSLDTTKETKRLEEFAEARKRAAAKRDEGTKEITVIREVTVKDALSDKLAAVEDIIKQEKYTQADAILQRLLKDNPNDEPRIYYAMGNLNSAAAASAAADEMRDNFLKEAAKAYNNVLKSAKRIEDNKQEESTVSFAALKSQTYFALGRIYEFFGDGLALDIYDAAIKLGEVKDGAYQKAVAAKERLLKDQ